MAEALALLNEELEQVRNQRETLRNKYRGDVLPEDARAEDEALTNRATKIVNAIEVEKQKARDAAFEQTARYMDEPQYQIRHAVNSDDDGRAVLMKAGWDIRGDMIYRQTSKGEIAFCPTEVMFGALPTDDPVSARYFQQMRATQQPEYRDAFVHWMRVRGDKTALSGAEQNALSEGTASDGGFLVPPDIQAEIMTRKADASVMRRICSVRPTSRNIVQWPAVVPNSSNGSIYSSGFVGGLVGERPVQADNGPTFQPFTISVKKFESYTKVTNDLIADSGASLMSFLAQDGGRNLGLVEDNYFITGDGTGLQPLGLLNSGITTADVEGTTSNTISNSVSDNGSGAKIIAMSYLLPSQHTSNGRWLFCRAIKGAMHALVDADGRPWWQGAGVAGGGSGVPSTLVEFPYSESPFMPDDGTNANKVLALGDFNEAIIADRAAMSVTIDPMNLIGSDETQIFIRSRAGFGVWNTDAFRIGIV